MHIFSIDFSCVLFFLAVYSTNPLQSHTLNYSQLVFDFSEGTYVRDALPLMLSPYVLQIEYQQIHINPCSSFLSVSANNEFYNFITKSYGFFIWHLTLLSYKNYVNNLFLFDFLSKQKNNYYTTKLHCTNFEGSVA